MELRRFVNKYREKLFIQNTNTRTMVDKLLDLRSDQAAADQINFDLTDFQNAWLAYGRPAKYDSKAVALAKKAGKTAELPQQQPFDKKEVLRRLEQFKATVVKAHSRYLLPPRSQQQPEVPENYYKPQEKDHSIKGVEGLMGIDYSTLPERKARLTEKYRDAKMK